jgi:hypothetical protein
MTLVDCSGRRMVGLPGASAAHAARVCAFFVWLVTRRPQDHIVVISLVDGSHLCLKQEKCLSLKEAEIVIKM